MGAGTNLAFARGHSVSHGSRAQTTKAAGVVRDSSEHLPPAGNRSPAVVQVTHTSKELAGGTVAESGATAMNMAGMSMEGMGDCRRSRGCSDFGAADGRLVVEATMRSLVVVVVGPWLQAV